MRDEEEDEKERKDAPHLIYTIEPVALLGNMRHGNAGLRELRSRGTHPESDF